MAYRLFGASAADYLADATGAPAPGASVTVWTAATGGAQVTDLLDASGTPTAVVTADSKGGFRFSAQDSAGSVLWLDNASTLRYACHAVGVGTRLDSLETAAVRTVNSVAPDTAGNVVVAGGGSGGLTFRDAATGNTVTVGQWVGDVYPTVAVGAGEGDLLFYTGP